MGTAFWGSDILFGAGASAFTDWSEISPGSITVDAIDGADAAYFSGSVSLEAGGIYTVVISGNVTNGVMTDEPIRFNTITH